jgi:hypothetical protein
MFQVMLSEIDVPSIAVIIICLTFSAFAPGFPVATIVTLVIPLQLKNASQPMLVTLSGIVTLVRLVQ